MAPWTICSAVVLGEGTSRLDGHENIESGLTRKLRVQVPVIRINLAVDGAAVDAHDCLSPAQLQCLCFIRLR